MTTTHKEKIRELIALGDRHLSSDQTKQLVKRMGTVYRPHIKALLEENERLEKNLFHCGTDNEIWQSKVEALEKQLAKKDALLDELLKTLTPALWEQIDIDCPGSPDNESVGWVSDGHMKLTFGEVRLFKAVIEKIQKERSQ